MDFNDTPEEAKFRKEASIGSRPMHHLKKALRIAGEQLQKKRDLKKSKLGKRNFTTAVGHAYTGLNNMVVESLHQSKE